MAKWISIKKRPPPKNEGVLVTDGKIITVASLVYYKDEPWWWGGWCFGGYEWDFDFESSFKEGAITHWMPLPDFPKTKE